MMRAETPHEVHLFGCIGWCVAISAVLVALSGAIAFALLRHSGDKAPPSGYIGDPARGAVLITRYGCPSCHSGIAAAPQGAVGPSLDHIAERAYIAGQFPNTRIRMIEWIRHPQAVKPGTAMPDLGVGERDAVDLSAYLATLR